MIGNAVKELLLENQADYLIPAENVAHVMEENPLNHALLVLTKVGYSKIPVINKESQFVGLISLSAIVDAMFDLTEIDPDNLANLCVKDVMEREVKMLKPPYDIEKILHLSVDNPFIPAVNKENIFVGIITRRELLKAVNHLAHELELNYDVTKKEKVIEQEVS